jgi:predicted amidohydrolase YtcJ
MAQAHEHTPRIVTAGRIHTMDGAAIGAFACVGEWITARGDLAELRERYPGAEVHDLGDATVVPGFNDAHQHPTICAEQLLQVDLSPGAVANTSDVATRLRERAAETPRGRWVIGCGYDPARTGGGAQLTRTELDEACPDHPVLVVDVTLHAGVVNSRGLELAGLSTTDDAPAGGELGSDGAGSLTGFVGDQALYDLAFPAFTSRRTVIDPPGAGELRDAFARFTRRLNAAGITSVGDAVIGPHSFDMLASAEQAGELRVRVNGLAAYEHFEHFRPLGEHEPAPDARLRLGGVKAFADGAVNGGACLVEEPTIGSSGHGMPRMPAEDLAAVIKQVHDAGWRVAVHANGDRAIRWVLDGIRAAQQANPRTDVRHRIEHTSVVNDTVVERMRELCVVAVPFAEYATAHGDKLRSYYEPERIERMFAHRTMLDAGIPVAGSSDYPCGPFEPLLAMYSLVTRLDRHGEVFGASQRITPAEALGLYTTGAAFASAEEDTKGRLAPGYLADFAVLEEDPLTVPGESLADIRVRETWLGGERVWEA